MRGYLFSGQIRTLLLAGVQVRSAALGRIMPVLDADPGDGWVLLKASARKRLCTRFSSGDRVWLDRKGNQAVIRNYASDLSRAFSARKRPRPISQPEPRRPIARSW